MNNKISPTIWNTFVSKMKLVTPLFKNNPKILVAISGGPDSMFLTYLLHKYSQIFPYYKLTLCYINHNIRPKKVIKKEILLIKNFALKLNIPFITTTINKTKKTDENTLRTLRYKKLFSVAKKVGCSIIAVGHTKNDVVETFLFNLFRGSGITGLTGIPAVRKTVFENQTFYIFRPLIGISKKDILTTLKSLNINFSFDETNLNVSYTRNFLRNIVLKKIEKLFPKYEDNIVNTAELMAEIENYISSQTEMAIKNSVKIISNKQIQLDFKNFLMYNSIIKKEILHKILDFLVTKNKLVFNSSYNKVINNLLHFFDTKNIFLEINKNLIAKKYKTKIIFKTV
jgi:tRNA(Ile)-lysidine synthase